MGRRYKITFKAYVSGSWQFGIHIILGLGSEEGNVRLNLNLTLKRLY